MKRGSGGFSMIEVLVSIVVLAFGLLGAAQLVVLSVNQQATSRTHTQVVFLAESMMERIRANQAAAWAGNYNGSYDASLLTSEAADCTLAAPCDGAGVAKRDGFIWTRELVASLSAAQGSIGCTPVGTQQGDFRGYCDLSISWRQATKGSDIGAATTVSWRFTP